MNDTRSLFCAALLALGCNSHANASDGAPLASAAKPPSRPAASSSPPSPSAPLDRPRTKAELPTTDAKLFLGNLEGSVSAARKAWQKNPSPSNAVMLAGSLAQSGELAGDLDRIAESAEIASAALKKSPDDVRLLLVRADASATLHRVAPALADAKRAHELAPSAETEALLADLAWQSGDYETAAAAIRKAAQRPSFSTLVRLAQLELDLGNVKAAEQAFARAETQIKDVSPVPVAWLGVQRGLLYLHTGQFERAERFYLEAVARLPSYPMALEHLAEIEALLGKREQAVRRYRAVIEKTDNPEFMAALAGVLEEMGKKPEADALRQRAGKRYDELLKKHPEAMYWHAADFFLEDGKDPKKALELLKKNAKLRPGAESWAALANAELAVGKIDDADKSIQRALATPLRHAEFHWTAARVKLAQGKPDEARAFEAKARAHNPRIDVLEGALR